MNGQDDIDNEVLNICFYLNSIIVFLLFVSIDDFIQFKNFVVVVGSTNSRRIEQFGFLLFSPGSGPA